MSLDKHFDKKNHQWPTPNKSRLWCSTKGPSTSTLQHMIYLEYFYVLMLKSSQGKNTVFIKVMYENDIFKDLANEFWIANRINYLNFNCQRDKGTCFFGWCNHKQYLSLYTLITFTFFIRKHMSWEGKKYETNFPIYQCTRNSFFFRFFLYKKDITCYWHTVIWLHTSPVKCPTRSLWSGS